MLTLLGSKTSPFVRRVRLFLECAEIDYQFEIVDIYSPEGQSRVKLLGPVRKVPILIDEEVVISDSRQILIYLQKKFRRPSLSWQEEEIFTAINTANDDLVLLLMLQRSGFDLNSEALLISNVKRRTSEIFHYLNKFCADGGFVQWNLVGMALYALLDWSAFRKLMVLPDFPHLENFLKANVTRPEVINTAIPKDA